MHNTHHAHMLQPDAMPKPVYLLKAVPRMKKLLAEYFAPLNEEVCVCVCGSRPFSF